MLKKLFEILQADDCNVKDMFHAAMLVEHIVVQLESSHFRTTALAVSAELDKLLKGENK